MRIDKTPQGVPCVTLKGRVFEISRWGAEEQTDTLLELMSILGDAAGSLGDIYRNTRDVDADIPKDIITQLVGKLTSGVTRDKAATKRLIIKLASGDRIVCDGVAVRNYGTFYADDLFLAFQVALACLHVQFGAFFSAAGSYLESPAADKALGQKAT